MAHECTTMGTLPQDLSLPTSRNRPYSPTMSTVPTSWRHRDKLTSTHWVWVEHSPTREAGWYTQQAGTWLRYQPDDSVQTQSQVRRHEGAARHYYTDYYDPLTGCTWTWFDTTNHYDEGWWAYSREGWTRYSPGPPRPSGVPHGGLAHAPPPRATSPPVVNLQVHMHPLPRMHAHCHAAHPCTTWHSSVRLVGHVSTSTRRATRLRGITCPCGWTCQCCRHGTWHMPGQQ